MRTDLAVNSYGTYSAKRRDPKLSVPCPVCHVGVDEKCRERGRMNLPRAPHKQRLVIASTPRRATAAANRESSDATEKKGG